jgi:hypothetical protein
VNVIPLGQLPGGGQLVLFEDFFAKDYAFQLTQVGAMNHRENRRVVVELTEPGFEREFGIEIGQMADRESHA